MTTLIRFMAELVGRGEGQWSWLMGFSAKLITIDTLPYDTI